MGTLSLSDYKDVLIQAPWGHISGRWYGNRLERPILALHGWLDNLGTFDTLIPFLPDYLGVLCIDLPGHGRSSHLPPGMQYSMLDYTYIIPLVMREYNWLKVSLMGHSLGGMMSFIYATLAAHTVDMIISLDALMPLVTSPAQPKNITKSQAMAIGLEKFLVEAERQEEGLLLEPPSYTLPQLENIIAQGSSHSVPPKFAKHLLYRSVTKSKLYPDKYYFSRDGRVKFYKILVTEAGLVAEMARRIKHKPYLVIKASKTEYVGPHCNEVIAILSHNNPHFEYQEVPGSHHVHLHNAEECAKYIVPFIRHHRPAPMSGWSLAGKQPSKREHRKALEQFFIKNKRRQRSKL